jgi:hypothetical protein
MSVLDMVFFMQSAHPVVNSMIVSVYSFTILGSVAQPCEVDQFGGPFVTYVRENDDLATFTARLRRVTGDGDDEWAKCRLAVVRNNIPHYLKTNGLATGQGSPWDDFISHYREFGNCRLRAVVADQRADLHHCNDWTYPQLGILRPVSEGEKVVRSQPKVIKIT